MYENNEPRKCILALGFFDGVHRGHAALISRAVARGRERGLPALAVTFDRHPAATVGGDAPGLLTSPEERRELCGALGVSDTLFLPFDRALCALPPEAFVRDLLCGRLHAAGVVVGENYTFGARRAGNARLLASLCSAEGITFDCVPPVCDGGEPISSTRVREALLSAELCRANDLLGHPFALRGMVEHGNEIGRLLSFPTANLALSPELLLPASGVYRSLTRLSDGRRFPSVTNIGTRPTVDSDPCRTVETHVMDFSGNLYGEEIRVELLSYLRPVRRFASREALSAQIRRDVAAARGEPL